MWALGYFVCQNVHNSYLNNIFFPETARARAGDCENVSSIPVILTEERTRA